MQCERIVKPDGRYLLLYTFPAAAPRAKPATPTPTPSPSSRRQAPAPCRRPRR